MRVGNVNWPLHMLEIWEGICLGVEGDAAAHTLGNLVSKHSPPP